MTDRRRSRWVAFDVHFYDNDLGVGIRERFGPVGLVLFSAFLCACKRSSSPGHFRYSSTADALNTLGLPGLRLGDENGAEFTLDEFWTYLGQRKMTRRTRRGRITDVVATRWERWQNDFGRQTEAEDKRRSRARNTPTVPGQSTDDAPTDQDLDPDNDKDPDQDPREAPVGESTAGVGDIRIKQALTMWLDEEVEKKRHDEKDPLRVEAAWREWKWGECGEAKRLEAERLVQQFPQITAGTLYDALAGRKQKLRYEPKASA